MDNESFDYGEDLEMDMKGGSFKDIALAHFNRCIKFMSVEFRGGYYSIIVAPDGKEKEIYVPDTREIYCNAVYGLSLILQPKYDDIMKEQFKTLFENIDTIKKEFIAKSSPNETVILGESYYENPSDKLNLETYKQKKLLIFINIFSELSKLIGRKNYFSIGGSDF